MIDVSDLIYDTIFQALYEQNSDSFIDFAEKLVNNGIESENIFILLGLSKDSYEDKLYYFKKSLTDLKYRQFKSEVRIYGLEKPHLESDIPSISEVYY